MGATLLGEVEEVKGVQREEWLTLYLTKHPSLKKFARLPSSVLLALAIKKIILVTSFQQVIEWRPGENANIN